MSRPRFWTSASPPAIVRVMEATTDSLREVAVTSKRLLARLTAIVGNRLELLALELEEERLRLLRGLLLALAAAVFCFLAGVALSIGVVILFWEHSPALAVVGLALLYAGCAAWFYAGFVRAQRDWRTLPDTIEQLRKDCECLERNLK